nr:hypothetical protein [uncultured Kingella sp.]
MAAGTHTGSLTQRQPEKAGQRFSGCLFSKTGQPESRPFPRNKD